jgi:hypothetical protein
MKLTKLKLQQIIKEELNEIGVPFSDTGLGVPGSKGSVADSHTAALNALEDYIAENYGADTKLIDLMQEAQEAVADYENPLQDEYDDEGIDPSRYYRDEDEYKEG